MKLCTTYRDNLALVEPRLWTRIFIRSHYILWLGSSALRVAKHVLLSRCSGFRHILRYQFPGRPLLGISGIEVCPPAFLTEPRLGVIVEEVATYAGEVGCTSCVSNTKSKTSTPGKRPSSAILSVGGSRVCAATESFGLWTIPIT